MFEVKHLDHVAITVSDLARSIEWYTRVIGLEHRPVADWGEFPQMVCAGDTCIALFPATTAKPKRLSDEETRSNLAMRHISFRVDRRNFELAQERFKELEIEARFADHTVSHGLRSEPRCVLDRDHDVRCLAAVRR